MCDLHINEIWWNERSRDHTTTSFLFVYFWRCYIKNWPKIEWSKKNKKKERTTHIRVQSIETAKTTVLNAHKYSVFPMWIWTFAGVVAAQRTATSFRCVQAHGTHIFINCFVCTVLCRSIHSVHREHSYSMSQIVYPKCINVCTCYLLNRICFSKKN